MQGWEKLRKGNGGFRKLTEESGNKWRMFKDKKCILIMVIINNLECKLFSNFVKLALNMT